MKKKMKNNDSDDIINLLTMIIDKLEEMSLKNSQHDKTLTGHNKLLQTIQDMINEHQKDITVIKKKLHVEEQISPKHYEKIINLIKKYGSETENQYDKLDKKKIAGYNIFVDSEFNHIKEFSTVESIEKADCIIVDAPKYDASPQQYPPSKTIIVIDKHDPRQNIVKYAHYSIIFNTYKSNQILEIVKMIIESNIQKQKEAVL